MAKVLFLESVATKEAKPQKFTKGEVYELTDSSAQHWISRQKAEAVDEDDERPVKPLAAAELSPEVRKHAEKLKAKKEAADKGEEKVEPSPEFTAGKPAPEGSRAPIIAKGESVIKPSATSDKK